MKKNESAQLSWRGQKTVEQVCDLIENAEKIVVEFPLNFNHALFRTLNAQAPESAVEQIDKCGGPQLLDDVATIRGLEALKQLAQALRQVKATVTLQFFSPPTLVIRVEQ